MKNKAGMWFILAIGCAIGLAIATGFAYYSRKYEDQFSTIKAMDPKIKVRESRIVFEEFSGKLVNERIYVSDRPVWIFCDEAIKANPKTNLVTSQMKSDALAGKSTWFVAQFAGPTTSNGVLAEIAGGVPSSSKLGRIPSQFVLESYVTKDPSSKSTLHVTSWNSPDPIEKLLFHCGFYR